LTAGTGVIERRMTMEEKPVLTDFPKIHCPFIRQTFDVNKEQWKEHGSGLNLRKPEVYLVVDRVNPGYEWVFEDPDTIAVEKLNGTNVKILTRGGRLLAVQNRKNVIDPLQVIKGKTNMAKLRRDMFDWYYSPKIEIFEYDKTGRNEIEDQEQFD
jgi:hypothetical protein